MRSPAGRAVPALLLVAVLVAGAAGPVAGQASEAATTMHVALEADGDARWTVSARFTLEGANETAAFDRLAEEHVGGSAQALTVGPYENAAALAGEATGRPMAIESVERSAERTGESGVLQVSFVWTNFTRVEANGSRLVLGDAFATPSGTWLPRLVEDQALVVAFPEEYAVRSSSRPLVNGTIRVTGPATFEPGQPSATLQRTGTFSPGPTTPGEQAIPTALSAGVVLALLLVGAYLLYRRGQDEETAAGEGAPAAAGPGDEDADQPDELLSDEERVLRLLRAEGGRMKQVDIVETTDWSNAKVSQLLTGMAEAGSVEKLRIGRENLISLPDGDGDE